MPKTSSSEITRELLHERTATLRAFAVRFERMAEQMEVLSVESVEASSSESWERGVRALIASAAAIQRAIDGVQLDNTKGVAAKRKRPDVHHREDATPEPLIVADSPRKYKRG